MQRFDWVEKLTAKRTPLLRRAGGGGTFPPLVKGGLGGVGRKTLASSVYSPFARKDVRKRHVLQAGKAAHCEVDIIDRSHQGRLHRGFDAYRPTPPGPPFARGGKRTRLRPSPRNKTCTIARRCQSQVFTAPVSVPLFSCLGRSKPKE